MKKFPLIYELPGEMNRSVGRIIVTFAAFEQRMLRIAYDLLGINPKQGRIAVRQPRGHELVEMVEDLAALAGVKLDFDFKGFASLAKEANTKRDLIAHGAWVQDPKTDKVYLVMTRGQWNPTASKGGHIPMK